MARTLLAVIAFAALASRAGAQAPPSESRPAPDGAPGQAATAPGGMPQLPPLPSHLQKLPTPRTPPPGWALASFNGGQLYLRSVLPFPKPGTPMPTGAAPDLANIELASVAEPFDVRQIQVRTARGQAVSPEKLAGLLAQETPVLVGFTTHPPDPTYLRVAKDEALVILLPPPQPPEGLAPPQGGPAGAAPSPTPAPR